MKRNIITINEEKCNGCGACVPDCPEGALQIIDGKARLVSDLFCDGLGACIKACPQDAMHVEEREAEPYDEYKVMENIIAGGKNVIIAHLKHLKEHGENKLFEQAIDALKQANIEVPPLEDKPFQGCPGMMQKDLRHKTDNTAPNADVVMQSELNNWPIQLKLLNPNAPYLAKADLIIAADCTAFAYANFHSKFLKNKVLMMLCPKLDTDINLYIEKLADIFEKQDIQSITLVHMEVPCCGGVEVIVKRALEQAGKYILVKDYTVSIDGELI
ncbi:MAG: 4Fe-4S binding protein [Candidatus Gastranaerophilales bacterium]|nr:4Fe-4S binding protein [Candidatus Gastranaerophilales bacterium]